ncbi:MAG: uroporphyrinogen-III synthase [Muribaculaceae bacterium]|nr:uroporphyrinogen-III synthase [Muribaculaceae bacterium]
MKVKKILVSQPKPASDKSPYYDIARKHDVEVVFRPFIKVEGLTSKEFRQQKVNLAEYTAIIFTARTAVDHFFRLCEEMRINVPATMKYFCVNEAIANYLQKYIVYRKRKIFASPTGKMDDLIPAMQKHKGEKYLLAMSETGDGSEMKIFEDNKVPVTPAAMYRTVSNDFAPDEAFDYDMLVFFSPVGIESLMKNFPDFKQDEIAIATFGEPTTKAAKDAGLRVDIAAPTPEAPSMTTAIDKFLTVL